MRLLLPSKQPQENSAKERADDSSPALTIYNQNFFVARDIVPLDLKPGINAVEYTGSRGARGAGFRHPARSLPGARCRSLSRITATIPSRRNCCCPFTKARPLIFSSNPAQVKIQGQNHPQRLRAQLHLRQDIRSRPTASRSSKSMAFCASACPASRCFPR